MARKIKDELARIDKRKFVIIICAFVLIICFICFMAKNVNEFHILKSDYLIEEKGYLDKIEVTLQKVNYIHNNTGIEATFEITNKTNKTITVTPDEYFKFYDINEVQIPNKYTSNPKIVKKDETIIYKLQYDITKKEIYEIYFYSQVVENNIKFSFNSGDISEEVISDNNVTVEEETKN